MGITDDLRKAALAGVNAARDWAARSDDDVSFEDMQSLLLKGGIAQPTDEKPRAMFHDPYSILDWGGWRQRPSILTYDTLRAMATSCTPIAAIINLRVNQISQFARPQQGDYDKGYRVVLRDRRDRFRVMTKEEKKRATEIERMLETTGVLLPHENATDRDSFRTFLRKGVRDTLTYDQFVYEKQRDRAGHVSRFICLPSETIRPAVVDLEHVDAALMADRVAYVQIYESTVIAEFAQRDIAWCVMNPRSDLRSNGFGFSPIEQIVRLVSSWLFGFEYNTRFFTQGSAIKGLLNIKGAVPDRQMRAFRRMWYAQLAGVNNAWRTPILNSEDVQWVNMHSTNREMEFSAWMDWLTKLICAVYGVDPIEINFQFGNTGQKAAMGGQNNEDKVVESKDKGLMPLVDHIQDSINSHILWDLEPDFEFVFQGLQRDSEESERDARIAESAAFKTVDEVRAEMELPALPDKMGQMIRDSTWLQWASGIKQEKQQAMQPEGGMPGMDDGGASPAQLGSGDDDDQPDDLLHRDDDASSSAHAFDDDDDLLHHQYAKSAARDVQRFVLDRLRKAEVRHSVEGDQQEIEIEV